MDNQAKIDAITELVEVILDQPELATSSDQELYFFANDVKEILDA